MVGVPKWKKETCQEGAEYKHKHINKVTKEGGEREEGADGSNDPRENAIIESVLSMIVNFCVFNCISIS